MLRPHPILRTRVTTLEGKTLSEQSAANAICGTCVKRLKRAVQRVSKEAGARRLRLRLSSFWLPALRESIQSKYT